MIWLVIVAALAVFYSVALAVYVHVHGERDLPVRRSCREIAELEHAALEDRTVMEWNHIDCVVCDDRRWAERKEIEDAEVERLFQRTRREAERRRQARGRVVPQWRREGDMIYPDGYRVGSDFEP